MSVTRFAFAGSIIAMCAIAPLWANAPTGNDSLGVSHDVYVVPKDRQTTGIASVNYANAVADAAGAAAQAAEDHAAAVGVALSYKFDTIGHAGNGIVTTSKEGDVEVTGPGTALAVDNDGVLNVDIANGGKLGVVKQGTNTSISTDGSVNVATANATTAGVVKVADTNLEQLYDYEGMFENGSYEYGSDEVLSAESVHMATAFMALAVSEMSDTVEGMSEKIDNVSGSDKVNAVVTTDSNGNVAARAPGDTMVVNNGVLNAKTANGDKLGVVKQGTNTTITNGAVNVATASGSVPGVMMWGQVPVGSANGATAAQIWIE